MSLGLNFAMPWGLIVSIDFTRKTFKIQYLQSQYADFDQITLTSSLGSRLGCILFWGRSDWNSGCHGNIYILMREKIFKKKIFSETTRPTALIFGIWQWLMVLCINYASHAPWVKFGYALGVDSLHRLTSIRKPSNSPIDSLFLYICK